MIRRDGWEKYCIWEHSAHVRELYARRCRLEEEEMTCAAQAAEILQERARPGETLLDVGCGSGYFYHSLRRRGIPVEYYGIDAAPSLVEIGRRWMPPHGLPADRLEVLRIDDLDGSFDHVLCMNVLTYLDNFHRPLERILRCARRTVILRESCKPGAESRYVTDPHLDPGVDLKVYIQTYDLGELTRFVESYGFRVWAVADRRSGGRPEMVLGYPHHWTFLVAERD